jgi:TfoX/Sxy family transcriptional regulator of competence genes
MAYDETLAERIRATVAGRDGISEQKMFGGLCFMTGGNMFCGVSKGELMVRIGPDNHDAASSRPGTRPMDFTGRPMRGYLFVAADAIATSEALTGWVEQCLAFTESLPPKKPAASSDGRTRR